MADDLGKRGEDLAAQFLRKQGFKILQRNCRSRLSELDLIVRDGNAVVFVEVKTCTSETWGAPGDAVTFAKRKKLSKVARQFADRHRLNEFPLRFDVVEIVWGEPPKVTHYRDAFQVV